MEKACKKQIRANILFTAVFSLILVLYCFLSSELMKSTDTAGQAAALQPSGKKVIVLDPGHGGEDSGAIGKNGVLEKDLNLAVSSSLAELLRFAGYDAVPTRTDDRLLYDRTLNYGGRKKVLDLAARLEAAQNAMPDIFVGIHMNSFPQEQYSGLSVYYSPNHPKGQAAASLIQSAVKDAVQPENNREIKAAGTNIFLLHRLECPAILIECGFISNPEECARLSTEEYRQELSFIFFSSLSSFLED